MTGIIYDWKSGVKRDEVKDLYEDAGWSLYLADFDRTMRAIKKSLSIVTARIDGKLIGFLRAVGDGETILYIQDIIVMQEYRRLGVGLKLLEVTLERYQNVRQVVLLADDQTITREFYQANNFKESREMNLLCFVKFQS
ncbi:MAG: GNAT family N-acetyltransferase [Halanaerobium sp.]|nr:GNAT family N-acetyltransferase [Halanaerobium sp.]